MLVQWRGGEELCLINALLRFLVHRSILKHFPLSNAFRRVRRQKRSPRLAPWEGPEVGHRGPALSPESSLAQGATRNHSRPYSRWCQRLLSPSVPSAEEYFSVAVARDTSLATKIRRISVYVTGQEQSDCGTETLWDCKECHIFTFLITFVGEKACFDFLIFLLWFWLVTS